MSPSSLRRPFRRRPLRVVLRAALAGAAATGLLASALAGAAPASAAPATATAGGVAAVRAVDPSTALAVRITQVAPAGLTPSSTLVVRGTVSNRTTAPVRSIIVSLMMSAALATRAEVTTWQDADPQDHPGQRIEFESIDRPLPAGGTTAFQLSIKAARLLLDPADPTARPYGLTVQAEGASAALPAGSASGGARTFTVWAPHAPERPVQLSVLVPVTAPTASTAAGTAKARPARDWTGRLARVVGATAGTPFSWAVDPALLSSAADAKADPGATTWLRTFTQDARSQDVLALPWADPDVSAVERAGAGALLTEASAAARRDTARLLGVAAPVVVWPAQGATDAPSLFALAGQRTGPVVLDSTALPSAARDRDARLDLTVVNRRKGTRVTPTTVSDADLSAALAGAGSAGSAATGTAFLLAQLAAAGAEHPGQHVLATAPRDWNPDAGAVQRMSAALAKAGWVTSQPYSRLATESATRARLAVHYPADERVRELPVDHVKAVAAADSALTLFAPALTNPDAVVPQLRSAALSLVGLGWRGTPAARLALARTPLTTDVDGLYAGLSVDPGSTKNLLATQGRLPITVHNALPYDVKVCLVLTPRTGQLVVPNAMCLKQLRAGQSLQVVMPVKAIANGDVAVVATLTTPDGRTVLYHSDHDILVRVRSDWERRGLGVVAVLLALLLVVGLGRGVRRGRRERIPPESVPDPDDIGRVAVPDPPARETEAESAPPAALPEQEQAAEPVPTAVPSSVAAAPVAAAPVAAAPVATGTVAPADGGGRSATVTATLPRTDLEVQPPPAATAPVSAVPPAPPPPTPAPPAAKGGGDGTVDGPASEASGPSAPSGQAGPGGPVPGARAVLGSSAVMAAGTFMSRVLGMVRVVVLAWAIGAAFSANAFTTANTLPNSLFLLIGGGVLNAVLVPQIVAAMRSADGGREYVDRLITLSLGLLAVATLVVTAAAPLLLRLFGSSSWSREQVAVGVAFAFWCLPQVFFYGLYTVLGQVLNARGSFGPYMWAPVVNNVVAIVGMVVFVALYGSGARPAGWWTPGAIAVLAGTTTLGVVAQALILVPVLRRTGFRWRPRRGFRGVGLRSAGEVAGWTFGALVVGQLGLVVLSRIANSAGQEAGAAGTGRFVYDTAYLLFMLPHSLVAVSVVTAVFTRMSHSVVAGRFDAVRDDVSLALRTTGVATVLASVAFVVLGQDLTSLLFATNTRATAEGLAWATSAMVLGLVPFSAMYLFQRVFYAFGDARTPFYVQVLVIALWTAGNLLAGARLSGVGVVVGIGLAMSLSNLVGAGVLAVLTRRRIGGIDGARVLSTYLKCVVAALLAGVLGWTASAATHLFAGEGTRGALAALLVGGAVLLLVYVAGLRMLRVGELSDLAAPVRRLVGG